MLLQLAFKHLFQDSLYPGAEQTVSIVCSHEATAAFRLGAAANRFPGKYFLRSPTAGDHWMRDWDCRQCGLQAPKLSQVQLAVWGLVTSISLYPLRSTWMVRDLQQTPSLSKLSLPDYRPSIQISSAPRYKPWCHSGINA
jgi:hypothetical protein